MKKNNKKIKKTIAIALSTCMLFSACGCNNSKDADKQKTNSTNLTANVKNIDVDDKELDEKFVYATADFSIELFKTSTLSDVKEGENVLISPESVLCALAMTANGAAGNTLTEMEDVIAGGMDIADFNEYLYTYNNRLTDSKDVEFYIANSLWIKDNKAYIDVPNDFLQVCDNYYDADAFMAPFDDSTVTDINNWVNKNTNEMIPSLINEIPEDVVMYLINAIAFEGAWQTPYEDYQIKENSIFTNAENKEEPVTMLCNTEEYFIKDDKSKGFLKYYEGCDYMFMAILPSEADMLDEYIANMSGEDFIKLYENREYKDVIVQLPEFTYEYDKELSEPLKAMGINQAFYGYADFSNMTNIEGDLHISRVLHKTFIQLDRNGTKAAAVTAVEMVSESCAESETPEEVILDRPFIYAIIDASTGLPIFMGVTNSIQ